MTTIGFIGLGLMGSGFTKRLRALENRVIGHDLDGARVTAAAAWGVEPAGSLANLCSEADIVALCLTTSDAVSDVVTGAHGLVASGKLAGKIVVDFSTTEMAVTQRVAAAIEAAGGQFIDAPVSGGPGAAETGTLAIMLGGADQAVAAVMPMLEQLGRATHMGAIGTGQATKLVNQVLCLTNYCVAAEALRLAEAYGVDAAKIPHALEPGLANSAVLQVIYPRMVEKDFAPRGYARQILKDFEMLHSATKAQHLALPMSAQAMTLFRMLVAQGDGELDGAAVVKLLPEVRGKA
ncbi:NAD(P)-dependent oxidoreductase [Aurantimonas sp. A2-1-M11]|uniref:NAD(P)-dependent oxidoreductase n=1 Tax=Aurantimonas sp. A2-1-M11 TaxID=3113712 RepID=UPI002F943877